MAELYAQYISGTQFSAGTITGSATGVSGINPVIDRLNSISTSDNLVVGSIVSGAALDIFVGDHGLRTIPQVVNVCYGSGATPPTASDTTEGTIYIQYTP